MSRFQSNIVSVTFLFMNTAIFMQYTFQEHFLSTDMLHWLRNFADPIRKWEQPMKSVIHEVNKPLHKFWHIREMTLYWANLSTGEVVKDNGKTQIYTLQIIYFVFLQANIPCSQQQGIGEIHWNLNTKLELNDNLTKVNVTWTANLTENGREHCIIHFLSHSALNNITQIAMELYHRQAAKHATTVCYFKYAWKNSCL